jgi:hypothetical protein
MTSMRLLLIVLLVLGSSVAFAKDEPVVELAPFRVNGHPININEVPDSAEVLTIVNETASPLLYMLVNDVPTALNDINHDNQKTWILGHNWKQRWIIRKYIFASGQHIRIKLVSLQLLRTSVFYRSSFIEKTFDLGTQFDENGKWVHGETWYARTGYVRDLAPADEKAITLKFQAAIRVWQGRSSAPDSDNVPQSELVIKKQELVAQPGPIDVTGPQPAFVLKQPEIVIPQAPVVAEGPTFTLKPFKVAAQWLDIQPFVDKKGKVVLVKVRSVTPGTLMDKAGVKAGAIVKSFLGVNVVGLTKDEFRSRILEAKLQGDLRFEIVDRPGAKPREIVIPSEKLPRTQADEPPPEDMLPVSTAPQVVEASPPTASEEQRGAIAGVRDPANGIVKAPRFEVDGKRINVDDVPDDARVITITNSTPYVMMCKLDGLQFGIVDDSGRKMEVIAPQSRWVIRKWIFVRQFITVTALVDDEKKVRAASQTFDLGKQFTRAGSWIRGESWEIRDKDIKQSLPPKEEAEARLFLQPYIQIEKDKKIELRQKGIHRDELPRDITFPK